MECCKNLHVWLLAVCLCEEALNSIDLLIRQHLTDDVRHSHQPQISDPGHSDSFGLLFVSFFGF